LKYEGLNSNIRSQIWEYLLYRANIFQREVIIAPKELKYLANTKFNSRQVGLLGGISGASFTDLLLPRSRT